ncbi:MAG: hypothetical protein AAFQ82_05170 [Myxococcota bacterium]
MLTHGCAISTPKSPWPASEARPEPSGLEEPASPSVSSRRTEYRAKKQRATTSPECPALVKRITVRFLRADIVAVLRFIADEAGLNLVVDGDVRGSVTVDLRDVTVGAALDALSKNYGLVADIERCILNAHLPSTR